MDYHSFHQLPKLNVCSEEPKQDGSVIKSEGLPKKISKIAIKNIAAGLSSFCGKRELVAGGVIKWKPVDRAAAMLLVKSPEINKPITIMANQTKVVNVDIACGALPERTAKSIRDDEAASNCRLENKLVKKSEEIPKLLAEKVDALKSVRASLDLATDLFRSDMVTFAEEMPKHVKALRDWRMTMEREKDTSLKALKELRQFFLEADHDKEMQRLSEFVRMCERLAALAADGTLEKVADVMLKLA